VYTQKYELRYLCLYYTFRTDHIIVWAVCTIEGLTSNPYVFEVLSYGLGDEHIRLENDPRVLPCKHRCENILQIPQFRPNYTVLICQEKKNGNYKGNTLFVHLQIHLLNNLKWLKMFLLGTRHSSLPTIALDCDSLITRQFSPSIS